MRKLIVFVVLAAVGTVGWFLSPGNPVETPATIFRRFGQAIRLADLPHSPLIITQGERFDHLPGADLTVTDDGHGALIGGLRLLLLDLADPASPKVIGDLTLPDRFRASGVRYLGHRGETHYLTSGANGVHAVAHGELVGEVAPWKGAYRLVCRDELCVTDQGVWRMKSPTDPAPARSFAQSTSRFVLFGDWVYWQQGGMLAYAPLNVSSGADSPEDVREIKLPLDNANLCAAPQALFPGRLAVECADTLSLLVGLPGEAPRLAQVVKEPLPGHLLRIDDGFVTGMTIPGLEGLTLRYGWEADGKLKPLYALDFASDMGSFPWTITGDKLMTVKEGTRGVILRLEGERPPTVVGEIDVPEDGRLVPLGMSVWRIDTAGATVFSVGNG